MTHKTHRTHHNNSDDPRFDGQPHSSDNVADAIAAIALIAIFVATCIFWISGS